MARGRGAKLSVAAAALAGVCYVKQNAFVSGPARRSALAVAPAAVAAIASAPAFADEIGDASKKLTAASYPFMKEVDWNSYLFNVKAGTASPAEWAKAVDKAIVMGASMDPDVLKKAVVAHHKAIGGLTATNPVLSEADLTEVNAAIGRMIASVPESQTMDVYNAFSAVVGKDVPAYLMSTVKEEDAKKAYEGFLEFKDVVKAHPITPSVAATPAALSSKLEAVGAAAAKLSAASYPFMKDVGRVFPALFVPFLFSCVFFFAFFLFGVFSAFFRSRTFIRGIFVFAGVSFAIFVREGLHLSDWRALKRSFRANN